MAWLATALGLLVLSVVMLAVGLIDHADTMRGVGILACFFGVVTLLAVALDVVGGLLRHE